LERLRIAIATLALAGMGAAAGLVVPALASPSRTAKATTVFVTAKEWGFKLSKKSFPAGTVVFKKKGKYSYVCTVSGHAKLGMKGAVGVGVKAPTVTTTPTTATTTVTGPPTTITVNMDEYHFGMSQSTVPQGNVTFVIHNVGQQTHNFDLQGKHLGAFLDPGQSETWTVNLGARTYHYVCDVPYHAASGMEGDLVVTG